MFAVWHCGLKSFAATLGWSGCGHFRRFAFVRSALVGWLEGFSAIRGLTTGRFHQASFGWSLKFSAFPRLLRVWCLRAGLGGGPCAFFIGINAQRWLDFIHQFFFLFIMTRTTGGFRLRRVELGLRFGGFVLGLDRLSHRKSGLNLSISGLAGSS